MQHFGYIDLTTGNGCVAQLVERSLPIPEVHGSNPVIGKNLYIYMWRGHDLRHL